MGAGAGKCLAAQGGDARRSLKAFQDDPHGAGSALDFGKVADVGEVFEVVVLGPQGGLVGEGDGVDQGIGKREFVPDEQVCCGDGDGFVDRDDDA